MKIKPNTYGMFSLTTSGKLEKKFLQELYKKGHILVVAKRISNKGKYLTLDLGESFKKSWKSKPTTT